MTSRFVSVASVFCLTLLFSACTAKNTGMSLQPMVNNLGFEVEMSSSPAQPRPGEKAVLTFTVKKNGRPSDIYEVPTRVIRISLASTNAQDFHHAFEDVVVAGEGTYTLTYVFSQADTYRIWMEIPDLATRAHHGKDSGYIGYADLMIGDGSDGIMTTDPVNEVIDGNMRITLTPQREQAAGVPLRIDVAVNATDGMSFETVPADHFYALVSPASGMYRLEHTDHALQRPQGFVTDEIVFEQPGTHVLWMELYLFEGPQKALRTLRPVFVVHIP